MAKKEELENKKEEEKIKTLQNKTIDDKENEPSVEPDKQLGKGKKKEEKENIKVAERFKDKYDAKVIYDVGDTFVEDSTLTDKKPVKVDDKKYKVSTARYAELKRSLYVD